MIDESFVTFAGGTRDRADRLRGDADALARLTASPDARALPLWRGKPLFALDGAPALAWLPLEAEIFQHAAETPVFLGLEGTGDAASARFAVDVSNWVDPETPTARPRASATPRRTATRPCPPPTSSSTCDRSWAS